MVNKTGVIRFNNSNFKKFTQQPRFEMRNVAWLVLHKNVFSSIFSARGLT